MSRVVVDTGVFVSYVIRPTTKFAELIDYLASNSAALRSRETLGELTEVLLRNRFDRYVPVADRLAFIQAFIAISENVDVTDIVTDCRDPKDNKFLALAWCGNADMIVTGDDDLLCLHPWRGIPILSAADCLATVRRS